MRDKMKESRFKLIKHVRNHYRAVAEAGASIETILKPEYFAHVATQLRIGDEITLLSEDMTFRLWLEVADTGPEWVRTRLLQQWVWDEKADEAGAKPKSEQPYEAVWKGPHDKWCIKRLSDDMLVQKGIEDKAQAVKAAATYDGKSV